MRSVSTWQACRLGVIGIVSLCLTVEGATASPFATPKAASCNWTVGPVAPARMHGEAITSIGNTIYTFAGTLPDGFFTAAYKYDGTSWTPIAPLPTQLYYPAAANDGTYIYIMGLGYELGADVNVLYRYNPVANSYTRLAPYDSPTFSHSAAYLNGKIYKLCGKFLHGSITTGELEIYDISTNSWTLGDPCPLSGPYVGAFVIGNFLYSAGGLEEDHYPSPKTYRYDPNENAWDDAAIADLPRERWGAAAGSYQGGGILAGGIVGRYKPTISASVLYWDPASNTWFEIAELSSPRFLGGGAVRDGSFHSVGGNPIGTTEYQGSITNQVLTCQFIPTPTPFPTATPFPTPAQLLNISTRIHVGIGSNVLIGGSILTGTSYKDLVLRGIGPSLVPLGIPDALTDPVLEILDSNGTRLVWNDSWQLDPVQVDELLLRGLGLQHASEAGIFAGFGAGFRLTSILSGRNGGTGIGLFEIYDGTPEDDNTQLANLSTRGLVEGNDNVMILGFILGRGSNPAKIALRGIGPSLGPLGVENALANPTLELHDSNGAILAANDDWQDDPTSAAQLSTFGLAPTNPAESGIFMTLPPNAFTAILAGKNGGSGVGLIEIYNLR